MTDRYHSGGTTHSRNQQSGFTNYGSTSEIMVAQTNESSVSVTYLLAGDTLQLPTRLKVIRLCSESRDASRDQNFFFNRGCFLRPAVRNPGGRYDGLPPWFEFLGEPVRGQTHHDRGLQGSGFEIPNLAQKGICWQRIRLCLTDQQKSW